MNKYLKLTLCIIAPLITGSIAGFFTSQGIATWYNTLTKPSFNPPNYLFAPVWTILYILMGISWYLILQKPNNVHRQNALKIFYIQWGLNFLWSFLFFYFHTLGLALIEIILMWLAILFMIFSFKKVDTTSAYLQIPYLCWVSFASILNASIWWINK